ncbi:unnamed protein product [Lampetra planeri]
MRGRCLFWTAALFRSVHQQRSLGSGPSPLTCKQLPVEALMMRDINNAQAASQIGADAALTERCCWAETRASRKSPAGRAGSSEGRHHGAPPSAAVPVWHEARIAHGGAAVFHAHRICSRVAVSPLCVIPIE